MDKDRLKKLCVSALDTSFPSLKISDFVVVPTFKFDDSEKDWVPDSYSLFVHLSRNGDDWDEYRKVEKFLESLLGFECCVDFS
jgi:hypothetical protein